MTSLNTQTKNKRILKALSPILIIEENKEDELISVSIAIIIDNAESLFSQSNYRATCILSKCLNNKPLKEIEKYILSNLK